MVEMRLGLEWRPTHHGHSSLLLPTHCCQDDLQLCLLWGLLSPFHFPFPTLSSDCVSKYASSYRLPPFYEGAGWILSEVCAYSTALQHKPSYRDLRHNLTGYDMPPNCLQRP